MVFFHEKVVFVVTEFKKIFSFYQINYIHHSEI